MAHQVSLIAENLSATSFAPYGSAFSLDRLERLSPDGVFSWTSFDVGLAPEPTRVAIVKSKPALRQITAVERHFHIEQTFVPLTRARFLFVVAPPSGDHLPDPAAFRAFVWQGDCVVRLHRGCWHSLGSPAALDEDRPSYSMLTGSATDDELRAYDATGSTPRLTQIASLEETHATILHIIDQPGR